MSKKHVFVVGLDEFNRKKLERLPHAAECDFHSALDFSDIRDVERYDMHALIETATERINATGVKPDAIVAYYDFPATDLVPILSERFGTRAPSLEAVLKCEHKFWSRIVQQRVIDDCIPQFYSFDPFDDEAYEKIALMPPYWIKPIKSFRSFLAYRINDKSDFDTAIPEIRENIGLMNEPFNYLFENFPLPAEFAEMSESCMAESTLSGSMCTVEGYVFNGEVVVYGVVDSVREKDRSSFSRYEYPSALPQEVQFRMADISRRAIGEIGLDNSPFNIEFFWDQTYNHVGLLEINPRISQAHTDLFEKVHGISHHSIMLDVALGRKPTPLEYDGEFHRAGNFMLRAFEDGYLKQVPDSDEIARVAKRIPGTVVKLRVQAGQRLSELSGQDSYSYELANIYVGGRDQLELLGKYHQCLEHLTFEIEREELSVP